MYGKGDKLEAQREGLLDADEERIFAPVAPAVPGETQPSAVPGDRRQSGDTAPIAMRATPGSLKVCMMVCQQRACCMHHAYGDVDGCFHALSVCTEAACWMQTAYSAILNHSSRSSSTTVTPDALVLLCRAR